MWSHSHVCTTTSNKLLVGNICKIEFKCSNDFRSLGDVFRQFDNEKIIKDNSFVLCGANVVSNINIKRVYDEHRRQQESNPELVLTMVLSETEQNDASKYFIAHDQNQKILSFRPPKGNFYATYV